MLKLTLIFSLKITERHEPKEQLFEKFLDSLKGFKGFLSGFKTNHLLLSLKTKIYNFKVELIQLE